MRFHLIVAGLIFAQISLGAWVYRTYWPANTAIAQENTFTGLKTAAFSKEVTVAAARFEQYEPFIKGKRLGLVVNHTAMVGNSHLVDTLLKRGHTVQRIFAPEHGFRGEADAGEHVSNSVDKATQIPIVSVYGENKKPKAADLADLDLLIFDIQDVGVRFYTYTSTMTYMMEACAELDKPLLILDRPNPNGHIVDGFILEKQYRSFVGLHPVPILHGLTVAEYARMIHGEGWLSNGKSCNLYYVPCDNYNHQVYYQLPHRPSPNLKDMRAVYLYASLCFFEGTSVSVGRGTDKPFQQYGHPDFSPAQCSYSFSPSPQSGAKNPLHNGKRCYGADLSKISLDELQKRKGLDLNYIVTAYQWASDKDNFFLKSNFLELLAGSSRLRESLKKGLKPEQIAALWKDEVSEYKLLRKRYLLYADFE